MYIYKFYKTICLIEYFIDESIRQTVGYALKGISQCEKPDLYLTNIIPLIYFATHYKPTESNVYNYNFNSLLLNKMFLWLGEKADVVDKNDIWKELWEDNVHNTEGILLRHLDSVYEFLGTAIKSSSWAMKAQVSILNNRKYLFTSLDHYDVLQAARSIGDVANKLGQQLNEDHRNKFIETIKTGLVGRTWDGKEFLLEALLQLNLSSG